MGKAFQAGNRRAAQKTSAQCRHSAAP